MFHFYYYRPPELPKMRSVSADYPVQAAVHHRCIFVIRLPTRLFSVIKRTKPCASPTAIENSVQLLSISSPSTTATKSPWVQTVVPLEPDAVSNACAMPTGKDKFQHFLIPIRITVSGRLTSRFSTLLKSVSRCAPSALRHLENDPLPFKRGSLAIGPSDINGSSICLTEFTRGKDCSNHPLLSEHSGPLCDNDCPPDHAIVTPEPQSPEEDQGTPGEGAIAAGVRHHISLGPNPAAGTDVSDAIPRNCVIERKKEEGFPDLEVAPSSTPTLISPPLPGPTHEVGVGQASRQPVVESNFLHFYTTLKPYIVQRELPSRFVRTIPPPIDDGPLPESDGFRVLEGPFTTPAGGTGTPGKQEPPCAPPPLPPGSGVLHKREPGVKHSDPCLAPAIEAPAVATSRQLVSQPTRLSDEILGKAMTWDLDFLHARTGFSQTLNSTLRSMQNKWQILAFNLAFETSDSSMFRDNYFLASKPLALQLPCSSPRITELDDDEDEPVVNDAAGEIQSCNGGASGSGSTQARQGSGSRARFQQSRSTHLPRGKKRVNEDDGDDRQGKRREKGEEPPVGDDPPPPGAGDGGVRCPYWVKDRQNCKKKSCIKPKKNLSKLKEHLRRVHFLHLDCPFEDCKFHAGDKFQINRHQRTAHAGQAARDPIPRTTDSKLLKKNIALGTRNLTWPQIYDICFREESEEPVAGSIMNPGGAGGSEGEEEEGEELDDDDEEDDGSYEDQENYDDYGPYEEHAEYQDRHTGNRGAAAAVEGNHQENLIPPSPFEANQSVLSDEASTILDSPGGFPFDFSGISWSGLFNEPSQGDNFPSFEPPPLPSPADKPWAVAEEYFSKKFEIFRGTCFEGLGSRHGTLPRTAQQMHHVFQDIDRVFGDLEQSAKASLNPLSSGSGPAAYYTRESCTYPAQLTSQSSIPHNLAMHYSLFPNSTGPVGGSNSALPSLTFGSRSSRSQPAVAPGSQPVGPSMSGPQTAGTAVHDPFGNVLARRDSKGDWSVADPFGMQPSFDTTHF